MKHKYPINFLFDYIFPTFILPNATNFELGVINYLVTKYNSKFKHNSLFQNSGGDTTKIFFDLFENSISHMGAPSIMGFFYESSVYEDILTYKNDSVWLHTSKNQSKFIYPIKSSPEIETLFGGHLNSVPNKSRGEYFWKNISKYVLDMIDENKAKILIDYSMEPFITKETYEQLNKSIEASNINNKNIILCVNSFNAKELYESWFNENQQKFQVRNIPFCLDYSSYFYSNCNNWFKNEKPVNYIENFKNSKEKIRPNYFLMKIKAHRNHRIALFLKMLSSDLLKYGDWSYFGNSNMFNINQINYISSKFRISNLNLDYVKNIYDTGPHNLQHEKGILSDEINAWTDRNFIAYENSYFNICFETIFESDYKSLTEKIFKPIINFQPFIFVAYPGALDLLRKLGFKTFNGFIDETYDTIENPSDRMEFIFKEVQKLCSMSIEEIHTWYWSMEDILIHNHNHLLKHHENKTLTTEFIKELSDFCHNRNIL